MLVLSWCRPTPNGSAGPKWFYSCWAKVATPCPIYDTSFLPFRTLIHTENNFFQEICCFEFGVPIGSSQKNSKYASCVWASWTAACNTSCNYCTSDIVTGGGGSCFGSKVKASCMGVHFWAWGRGWWQNVSPTNLFLICATRIIQIQLPDIGIGRTVINWKDWWNSIAPVASRVRSWIALMRGFSWYVDTWWSLIELHVH